MKKQNQTKVDPSEMSELVNNYRTKKTLSKSEEETLVTGPKPISELIENHRGKQVSGPKEANRGENGRYSINRAEAAQYWFKAAKEQHPDDGFLGVGLKKVDAEEVTGKFENNRPAEAEMLYKGKKKEIVKE